MNTKLILNPRRALFATRSSYKRNRKYRITLQASLTENNAQLAPPSWPTPAARKASFHTTQSTAQQQTDISGTLPPWLKGMYLRNGPGTYENGSPQGMLHMFDGYAMIVKLDINGECNTITSSHAFVESSAYSHYKSKGRMKWREFATPIPSYSDEDGTGQENTPSKTNPSHMFSKFLEISRMSLGALGLTQGVTDNASVNILPIRHGGTTHFWAVTETVAGTIAIDPSTLRTLGRVSFTDSLRGDLTTAHPTIYPNGDLINILSDPVAGFTVYKQQQQQQQQETADTTSPTMAAQRESIAVIPHRRPLSPSWIHDFPSSTNYIIIPECPAYFNLPSLMLGTTTDHIFLDWIPDDGVTMHVVRLSDGRVASFRVEKPFFVFHWVNAFESEDGKYLHIDGAVYDDLDIVNHLYLRSVKAEHGQGKELPSSSLLRLTLNVGSMSTTASGTDGAVGAGADCGSGDGDATIDWEKLIDSNELHGSFIEFPCVHPSYKGKEYRYAWGTCAVRPTNVNNAIGKFDTVQGTCTTWHEPGSIVGEPTFIPRPGGVDEDDGVILSLIMQGDGTSALLVLDGKTHAEVARARVGYGITNGFHGTFVFT